MARISPTFKGLELRPKNLCATALHDTAQPCNRFLHFDLCTNPACELFLPANPLHGHPKLGSYKAFNAPIPSLRTWRRKGSTPPSFKPCCNSRSFSDISGWNEPKKKQLIKAKRDTNLEPKAALTSFMLWRTNGTQACSWKSQDHNIMRIDWIDLLYISLRRRATKN